MSYQDGFVLSIKEQYNSDFLREDNVHGERIVYMPFNREYSLFLKNKTFKKAKFQVRIDGRLVAPADDWFVINPHSSFELERFMLDGDNKKGKKFKFVDVRGSGQEEGASENGLVEVTIRVEADRPRLAIKPKIFKSAPRWDCTTTGTNTAYYSGNDTITCSNSVTLDSFSAGQEGVTEGGSESRQEFETVADFKTNKEIKLRIRIKGDKACERPPNVVYTDTCPGCNGARVQTRNDGVNIICPVCNGSGVFGG